MMLHKLNPFNYLAGRIFVWFWLAIVLAISGTFLITDHLSNRTEIHPLPAPLKQQISRQMQRRSDANTIEHLLREAQHPRNQWLVVDKTSHQLLNPELMAKNADSHWLIELANLDEPRIVRFRDIHIAGPFLFTLQGKPYAVYQQRIIPDMPGGPLKNLSQSHLLALLLIFSGLTSLLLALSISRPLRGLLENHLQFAQGKLDSRAESLARRRDELGKLGQGFNTMADRISALLLNQQRLLRDVSHELRSPLTRAQLALSLEEQQGQGTQLPRIQQELNTIDDMLDELLTFSRLDAGQYQLNYEPIKLDELISEILQINQVEADNKQQTLTLHSSDAITVKADARLLGRAIENIVRNAMKYSPANSAITVTLSADVKKATITIADQGPGIAREHLDAIFRPFYRVSDSRSSQTGGTGLGLAIAAQAVRQHGGGIIAENGSEGGLLVRITLPM